jgi:hypothetical protein
LLGVYSAASPSALTLGRAWYPKARGIVREWSESYLLPLNTVACVVAALSPQCDWARNLIIADDILSDRPISIGGALHANIAKARSILAQQTGSLDAMLHWFPYGPKVNSFAANLAGIDTLVTVDTHASQAALNDVRSTVILKWTPYRIFAECYVVASERVSIAPATFQAIVWHAWKERYPKGVKNNLRRKDRR